MFRFFTSIMLVLLVYFGLIVCDNTTKINVQLTQANKYSQALLLQNAIHMFWDTNDPYGHIRVSIDKQEKLYRGYEGKYTFDQINKYLGFFETLGGFVENGTLDINDVSGNFGYVIMEAYEYPEVKRYIADIRKNSNESDAFDSFEQLAEKIEAQPKYADFLKNLRSSLLNIKK